MTALRAAGTCFGFAVASTVPLVGLRDGGDGTPLAIHEGALQGPAPDEEVVATWDPSPDVPVGGALHRDGTRLRVRVADGGWFAVSPGDGAGAGAGVGATIELPPTGDPVRREERLWSVPAMLCFLARGDTALHSAAVEVGGEAIVLAAPGTFGKTTLAAAFHVAGHRLLSEDNTCVRTRTAEVIPGPAMLRLRPDVAAALEVPGTSRTAETDERVHLAIDPSRRGDCAPVPLRSVVLLRGTADEFRLERADAEVAVRDLFALAFRFPNDADRRRCFEAVADLARAVPVWNLWRPLTYAALPATVEQIVAGV